MKRFWMRNFWLAWWFAAFPVLGQVTARTDINVSTPIRVLLDKAGRKATLESPGQTLFVKAKTSGPWVSVGKKATLAWSEKTREILVESHSAKIAAPILLVRGGPKVADPIRYDRKTYRGLLKFVGTEDGWMTINVLPIEEYLAGTLAAEMNADWQTEALKAQAVASRTYALRLAKRPKSQHYDLLGTVEDQVYSGADAETKRVREAVESTKGEYLTKGAGPAQIFFHSRCGGFTEPEDKVWKGNGSHHVTVPCPYCRTHPFEWKYSVDYATLADALRIPKSLVPPKLTALERSPTGRVTSLKLDYGLNGTRFLDANTLRSLLGYQRLKSAHFDWKTSGGQIHFAGQGAGHGVGMCQWGAYHLAKQGKTYRDILAHYYPQLTIEGAALPMGYLEAKNRWR
jgi:SpoIID/LytB domain protein